MLSTCPNCKKQIEHEDFLFEVLCECSSRFNPFMLMENPNPLQGLADAPQVTSGSEVVGFRESTSALQEIRAFGEGQELPATPGATDSAGTVTGGSAPTPRAPAPVVAPLVEGTECPVSTADALPGFHIEASFLPVSAIAELDASGADPMRGAFQALWQHVVASGGNGCVSLRWQLLPDGGRVVVSGIPVRCARQ